MISTHAAFKKLVQNGMSEKLAETVTEVMEERQDHFATKADVEKLEIKIDLEFKWMRILMLSVLGLLIKIAFFG